MTMFVNAVIWDFDGTIGDTFERNLRVTREIVRRLTDGSPRDFPALRTLESYASAHTRVANWRDFYLSDLGLTEEQTNEAGRLWTEIQLKDGAQTPVYEGIEKVLDALQGVPHGIVSQNAKRHIRRALETADLLKYFSSIVGYEEVDLNRPKPEPDGLLRCIEELAAFQPGYIFYIGDHDVDIETAVNAGQVLEQRGLDVHVVSVAAAYGSHVNNHQWRRRPHFIAREPLELIRIVESFQPGP